MRLLCLAISVLTLLTACATTPYLPFNQLRRVLSSEVWPGFQPLNANIVIYGGGKVAELASYCRGSGMGCAPLPAPEQAPDHGAFFVPDNVDRDYAFYPNLGLLETARLIAHEQFHAYQRSASEFEGVDGVGDAPLSINDLDANAVAAALSGYRALASNLGGSPQSCDQRSAVDLPQPLREWLLNIERLEGLAQYVDLAYGAKAAGTGKSAIADLLQRELRRLDPAASYDILTVLWSSAYLTGAAKAVLHGPAYVLGDDNRLLACTPSNRDIEHAKALLQRSVAARRQAEASWERGDRILLLEMSRQQYSVVSQKRLFYQWGTMLMGNVHIRSGEHNLSQPIAAIVRCGKGRSLLVTPLSAAVAGLEQTGEIAPARAISDDLCHLPNKRT